MTNMGNGDGAAGPTGWSTFYNACHMDKATILVVDDEQLGGLVEQQTHDRGTEADAELGRHGAAQPITRFPRGLSKFRCAELSVAPH